MITFNLTVKGNLFEALILYLDPVLVVLLVVELAAPGAREEPDIVLSV